MLLLQGRFKLFTRNFNVKCVAAVLNFVVVVVVGHLGESISLGSWKSISLYSKGLYLVCFLNLLEVISSLPEIVSFRNYVSPSSPAGGWVEKASSAGTIYTWANHVGKQRLEDKQFVSCPGWGPRGGGDSQKKYFRWWDLLEIFIIKPSINLVLLEIIQKNRIIQKKFYILQAM